jgi:hypothetical protein
MLLLTGLAGCATMTGSTEQMVLVQTIFDNRQLAGAGCILSNDMGKWFVTTPGRIMIRKSQAPLKVDCKKSGSPAVVMDNQFDAAVNGGSAWSNVIFTLGVGYFVDRDTGAAYDYPSTLTVIMQDPARIARPAPPAVAAPVVAAPPAAQPATPAPKPAPSPIPDPVVY